MPGRKVGIARFVGTGKLHNLVPVGRKTFKRRDPVVTDRAVDNPSLRDGGGIDIQSEIVIHDTEPCSVALQPGNGSAMGLNQPVVTYRANQWHALPDNVLEHVFHKHIIDALSKVTAHRSKGCQTRYLEIFQKAV